MKQMEIWAHRGASGYEPENTLEAFALAIEQKADGIELDVQLSRDGEIMVLHDEIVDRVTNFHGFMKDYTLKQLK
ncbi:MAG: glycerophosphodiester phosphodiesterase family protein, partial [Oliverpabstia intestinalis]